MSLQIILADKPALPIFQVSSEALEMRDNALADSALIGRVENAEENELAVRAHQGLKGVAASFEKARKKMKEPLLDAGRQLDRAINAALLQVEQEVGRISNLTSQFQLAEQRRVREEQDLQQRELQRIEREKRLALAKAETPEQVQVIEDRAFNASMAESKPIEATRTLGQIVKADWNITVVNPYELAKFHPDCVKIEPLLTPIKAALNAGIQVKGIKAERITKTDVRVPQSPAAIDI